MRYQTIRQLRISPRSTGLRWLPIARAFKLARGTDPVMVFPGCFHNPGRDALPAHGHALRHVYGSIMVGLGIDPLLRKMLLAIH
jgi:hypothetical protein